MLNKYITFNRLVDILSSINPNVVTNIHIHPNNNCSSDNIAWFDIILTTKFDTTTIYSLWVADCDDRYTEDGIVLFNKIINKYKLNYTYDKFPHYARCEKRIYTPNILTPAF